MTGPLITTLFCILEDNFFDAVRCNIYNRTVDSVVRSYYPSILLYFIQNVSKMSSLNFRELMLAESSPPIKYFYVIGLTGRRRKGPEDGQYIMHRDFELRNWDWENTRKYKFRQYFKMSISILNYILELKIVFTTIASWQHSQYCQFTERMLLQSVFRCWL